MTVFSHKEFVLKDLLIKVIESPRDLQMQTYRVFCVTEIRLECDSIREEHVREERRKKGRQTNDLGIVLYHQHR